MAQKSVAMDVRTALKKMVFQYVVTRGRTVFKKWFFSTLLRGEGLYLKKMVFQFVVARGRTVFKKMVFLQKKIFVSLTKKRSL